MRIKADFLRVKPALALNGDKLEPEQMPMQRVMTTDVPASMQGGRTVGTIPTEIITETSVGEIASAIRNPCFSCKRFNAVAWKKLFDRWNDPTSPIDERNQLNSIRAALLTTSNAKLQEAHIPEDNDMDVEHAIASLGMCEALTEVLSAPIIVHPTSGCPAEYCTPAQPNGFYKPKDRDHERMGSKVFDNVMRMATGKR